MGKKLAIRNVCVGGYKVIMAIFWVIEWISSNKLFSVSFLGRIEHQQLIEWPWFYKKGSLKSGVVQIFTMLTSIHTLLPGCGHLKSQATALISIVTNLY